MLNKYLNGIRLFLLFIHSKHFCKFDLQSLSMYIQSICSINPSGILTDSLQSITINNSQPMLCAEPDYKDLIPAMQLRRMSKTLRTGVAAAKICLQNAGIEKPNGIHIGTAYGVLDDSEKFLKNLIQQNEQTLTPTAFIQSTHNTVSGQIALSIGCTAHNMTFVHEAQSFENALLDAELLLGDLPEANVLVGAVEECTPTSFDILKRFDIYNDEVQAGEGATFFVISNKPTSQSMAKIVAYDTINIRNEKELIDNMQNFFNINHLSISSNDTVIFGNNNTYEYYQILKTHFFSNNNIQNYNPYSGEYPTAISFGLAYSILAAQQEPSSRCWLINNYENTWSVFLIDICNLEK